MPGDNTLLFVDLRVGLSTPWERRLICALDNFVIEGSPTDRCNEHVRPPFQNPTHKIELNVVWNLIFD